jgi:hypothetical protein
VRSCLFCSFGIVIDHEQGHCGMLLEHGTCSLFDIIRKRRGSAAFTFEEKVNIALQLSLGLQVRLVARAAIATSAALLLPDILRCL